MRYAVLRVPGSPQEGPALLRVALCVYAKRSSVGGPCGPTGQPWPRRLIRRFWGFPPFFLALVETIALAVHFQDMNMVGQAIQQCPGQAFGAEHLGPLIERQIAGHQGGATLVALAEDLEQKFGAGLRERPRSRGSSMIRRPRYVASCFCRRTTGASRRTWPPSVVNQGGGRYEPHRQSPFWQAARPRPRAIWVLAPVRYAVLLSCRARSYDVLTNRSTYSQRDSNPGPAFC